MNWEMGISYASGRRRGSGSIFLVASLLEFETIKHRQYWDRRRLARLKQRVQSPHVGTSQPWRCGIQRKRASRAPQPGCPSGDPARPRSQEEVACNPRGLLSWNEQFLGAFLHLLVLDKFFQMRQHGALGQCVGLGRDIRVDPRDNVSRRCCALVDCL